MATDLSLSSRYLFQNVRSVVSVESGIRDQGILFDKYTLARIHGSYHQVLIQKHNHNTTRTTPSISGGVSEQVGVVPESVTGVFSFSCNHGYGVRRCGPLSQAGCLDL